MVKKFASMLDVDASNYEKIIRILENNGFDGLHLDVMDGHFVKNFAFGPQIIKSLRRVTNLAFNVHLEIENPGEYLDMFIDIGCNIITIHPQTSKNVERDLRYIKARGVSSSIAIDPDIKVSFIEKYLPLIDNIIVLCVYPGFGKQKFIKKSLQKIKKVKEIINKNKFDISISVDGSINKETAKLVIEHGANILIYGSGMFEIIKFTEHNQ